MGTEQILDRFPKQRPPLPEAQQALYEREFLTNRRGTTFLSSLVQKMESWMHRQVRRQVPGGRLLEVGAGTLNQIPYHEDQQIEYYDAVEPGEFAYRDSPLKGRVRHFYDDIEQCGGPYDAVFSVATLEHVVDLPRVIAKMGMLLAEDGICISAIPSEGGFLWGATWRCSTGIAYKLRTGYSYEAFMRHQHINSHDEIIALHRYFFGDVALSYFPLSGKHLSFYCCITARQPRQDICRRYLDTHSM